MRAQQDLRPRIVVQAINRIRIVSTEELQPVHKVRSPQLTCLPHASPGSQQVRVVHYPEIE
jgi:hypothetical protein